MANVISALTAEVLTFRDERDWAQFHTLKNLMVSLSIEASELLEHAQWKDEEQIRNALSNPTELEELSDECADVFVYLLMICREAGIDLEAATRAKLAKNAAKYPVAKAYGSAAKYSDLDKSEVDSQ